MGKCQSKILKHTLEFPIGKARDSVYGSPQTHTNYDGYHLRADKLKSGKDRAATKSLVMAFRSVGLQKVQNTVPKSPTQKNLKKENPKKVKNEENPKKVKNEENPKKVKKEENPKKVKKEE